MWYVGILRDEAKRPINRTCRWINCAREHYNVSKRVKRVDTENTPNGKGTLACTVSGKF
jgi:hypothetical protein